MHNIIGVSKEIYNLVNQEEQKLNKEFKKIDEISEYNSIKVLKAFQDNMVAE